MGKTKEKISKEEQLFNKITNKLASLRTNFKNKTEEDNFIQFFHIVRLFYSELFSLNYEFTFEELNFLMSKKDINNKLKDQISGFNNSLTQIEFAPVEFNSKMFYELMDEFTLIFNDLLKWKKEAKNKKIVLEQEKKQKDKVKEKSLFSLINPFKKKNSKVIISIRKHLINGYLSLDSSDTKKAMQEYHRIGEEYSKLDSISKRDIKPEIDDFLNDIKNSKDIIEKEEKKEIKKEKTEEKTKEKQKKKIEEDNKKTKESPPKKLQKEKKEKKIKEPEKVKINDFTRLTKKNKIETKKETPEKQKKIDSKKTEKELLTNIEKEINFLTTPEITFKKSNNDPKEIKKFYNEEKKELKALKVPELENLAEPNIKKIENKPLKKEYKESKEYGEILILIKEAYEELKKKNIYETVNRYHIVEDKYYELSDFEKNRCYKLVSTLYKAIIKLRRLYYFKEYHNEIAEDLKSSDALSE